MATTTSTQLRAQIKQLEQQALALEQAEVKEVIEKIQVAIKHYRLTPADLFGNGSAVPTSTSTSTAVKAAARANAPKTASVAKAPAPSAAPVAPTIPAGSKLKGTKVPPKYRDDNGNIWTGRGSQPKWLATALADGKTLQDFAV